MSNLASIPLTTIDGKPTSLAEYAGKVLLVVNVASKCGLTPQYTALEKLYQKYKGRGFAVLGFPANDFANQEPLSNKEIQYFCSSTYPVSFPLFEKTKVVGEECHPLYRELKAAVPVHVEHGPWRQNLAEFAAKNGFPAPNALPELLWNFEKFLVAKDGEAVARFAPDMPPDDPRIAQAIEAELSK